MWRHRRQVLLQQEQQEQPVLRAPQEQPEPAGEAGTAGAEGTAGTAGAGTEEGTQVIEPEEVPQGNQDVVDLDEDETPLADNPEETKEKVKKGLPLAAGIAIGVGAVAALSGLAVLLIRRRR